MKEAIDRKIFLIDDDPFVTAFLEQILNNLGYTDIEIYFGGIDCMANINHNPEVVFLDYQMDDMNGIEVLKEIKKYSPDIQVIFTTSFEDLDIAVQSLTYGSFDFLLKKNISEHEIESILNRVL